MSAQKISRVFGLRTSGKPQNCQISYYWYVWDQPRSLTSDDLEGHYAMSNVTFGHVLSCHVLLSCIMSPFQPMAASRVAENMISLKSRLEVVLLMIS